MLLSLVERTTKVFFRDKMLVFFSFLYVFISIILFIAFLEQQQIRSLGNVVNEVPGIKLLVSEWMIAGILAMTAMTSTLAVFAIFISDKESKRTADFLTTTGSRASILLSYLISAVIIGFMLTMLGYAVCTGYLMFLGADFPNVIQILKVTAVIAIGIILSAMINLLLVLLAKTAKAFSTMNSLVGTLIGFLCAVYIPIGVLPNAMQLFIEAFPVSHIATMLRQLLMENSLRTVFADAPVEMVEYKLFYGVVYEMGGTTLTVLHSILYIFVAIVLLGGLAVGLFRTQNK